MNLKFCAAVLIFTSSFAYAGDEAGVRKFISQYDAAYSERSVEKIEALLANEYQVVVDGKLETRAYAFHIPLAINARQGPGAFHPTTTLLTLESDPSPFAVDASALIRGLLI